MTLADANVLIYAFRTDTEHHAVSRKWLDGIVSGAAAFGVSPLVLSAVVRITTNMRRSPQPSLHQEVFGFCDDLLVPSHCRIIEPGPNHWQIFKRQCTDTGTTGPDVTDAWFAALAIEHGCTWISFDRDFARFPQLDWREPS